MAGNADRIQYLIKDWLEENDLGSTEEISAGISAPYATVARNIKILFTRGEIEKTVKNAERYIKWTLTGHSSQMPMFKGADGKYISALDIFNDYIRRAQKLERLPKATAADQAMLGICWAFVAATRAGMPEKNTLARQALTISRNEMIQALTRAEKTLTFIRDIIRDPKLNAGKPNDLISVLLQDERNPIDLGQMLNDCDLIERLMNNK